MTDRKLLELAAKAAGIALSHWNDGLEPYSSGEGYVLLDNRLWNPLTDDGDAFRLSVDLHMLVDIRYGSPGAIRYNRVTYWVDPLLGQVIEFGDMETCLRAATRRAIVRAAAELAKQEKA